MIISSDGLFVITYLDLWDFIAMCNLSLLLNSAEYKISELSKHWATYLCVCCENGLQNMTWYV